MKTGLHEDYQIPDNVLRQYWRSMRFTGRRFNKKN